MPVSPVERKEFLETISGRGIDGVALRDSLEFDGMHEPFL
jgi:hypothetical protein